MKKDFKNFIATLKPTIKTWDYFVDWQKVVHHKSTFEIVLHKWNYLLGKDNLELEFTNLIKNEPNIITAIPILLAVRDKNINLYDLSTKKNYTFFFQNKPSYSDAEIKKYFRFIKNTGLISIFKKDGIKNLVDYVFGVEVGLDSNGRKNRGGKFMESIVENFISDLCQSSDLQYMTQASPKKIQSKWGKLVQTGTSERNFDFAVYSPKNQKLKLFETNFYNGGGSKLKAVCGEFKVLHDELKAQNIDFIWITDGIGWLTAQKPLKETFDHNDFVFNLTMLENNILKSLSW